MTLLEGSLLFPGSVDSLAALEFQDKCVLFLRFCCRLFYCSELKGREIIQVPIKRIKFNAQEVDIDVFHGIYVCTLEYKSYSKSGILGDSKSDFVFNNDFQEVWFLSSLSVSTRKITLAIF